MSYYSTDPRDAIRTAIGTEWDVDDDGNLERCIVVQDDNNDTVYVPLLKPGQTRGGTPAEMPFIEMTLMSSPAISQNIGGDVRETEAYIDCHIYYPNLDNFTATDFGKTVADQLVDRIVVNRSSVASEYFVEPIDEGREIIEGIGKQTIFHRVVEIRTYNIY